MSHIFHENRPCSVVITMKAEFPEVYEALVVQRNNNWMEKIPLFIEDKSRAFVLVGAMHLNGDDGLIKQLKKQDFTVEPL